MTAPSTSPYLLAFNDATDLPNSRSVTIASGSGLSTQDFGGGGNFVFNTINALNAVNNIATAGYMVATITAPYFEQRQFTSIDGSLLVLNPTGVGGNTDFAVVDGQTIQKINYFYDTSTPVGTGSNLNLIAGDGVDITAQFDSETGFANYTFTSNGGSGGGGASQWSLYPALQNVNIANFELDRVLALRMINAATLPTTTGEGVISTQDFHPFFTNPAGHFPIVTSTNTNFGVTGTVLVGNGGNYSPLIIGSEGQVLTVTGGVVEWAPGSGSGANWSTYPALQNVNMANYELDNTAAVAFTSGTISTVNHAIYYFNHHFLFNNSIGQAARVVGCDWQSALYGIRGTLLVGDGNETGYAILPIGNEGDVLTINEEGDVYWGTGGGGGGGGGGAQGVLASDGTLFVSDPSIIESSAVFASSLGFGSTEPAAGPITVQLNPGTGFTISGDGTNDGSKGVAYTSDLSGPSRNAYIPLAVDCMCCIRSEFQGTTADFPAFTYDNGVNGLGATITITATGLVDPKYTDGVQTAIGTRILFTSDTDDGISSGIYVVTHTGEDSTSPIWTRTTDFNKASQMINGTTIYVANGIAFINDTMTLNAYSPIVIGTTPITFAIPTFNTVKTLILDATIGTSPETILLLTPPNNGRVFVPNGNCWVQNLKRQTSETIVPTFSIGTKATAGALTNYVPFTAAAILGNQTIDTVFLSATAAPFAGSEANFISGYAVNTAYPQFAGNVSLYLDVTAASGFVPVQVFVSGTWVN